MLAHLQFAWCTVCCMCRTVEKSPTKAEDCGPSFSVTRLILLLHTPALAAMTVGLTHVDVNELSFWTCLFLDYRLKFPPCLHSGSQLLNSQLIINLSGLFLIYS